MSTPVQPSRVFLDLDGCLVDSRLAITTCLQRALVDLSLPVPPVPRLARLIGPPFAMSLPVLLGELGQGPDRTDELIAAYRVHYAIESVRLTTVVPQVPAALSALRAGGHSLVLCTSKPHPSCDTVVEAMGLRPLLDGVFGPPDFARSAEPKTATLARAREAHPGPAVMVGDREHDVLAGIANGAATIGVLWGIGAEPELQSAGADRIVEAPPELPDAVAQLLAETHRKV